MLRTGLLSLLRYSQLVALAVIVAIVVALSLLYRGVLFDSMVQSETHASVALSKAFANAVWSSHAGFVARAASLEGATLAGGHIATRQGNRLGVMTCGARSAEVIPPLQGRHGRIGRGQP